MHQSLCFIDICISSSDAFCLVKLLFQNCKKRNKLELKIHKDFNLPKIDRIGLIFGRFRIQESEAILTCSIRKLLLKTHKTFQYNQNHLIGIVKRAHSLKNFKKTTLKNTLLKSIHFVENRNDLQNTFFLHNQVIFDQVNWLSALCSTLHKLFCVLSYEVIFDFRSMNGLKSCFFLYYDKIQIF